MSINTGWDLETVMDFDIDTFSELLESLLRLEYMEKTEAAWTLQVAAQGTSKDMKKWVGQWKKILNGGKKTAAHKKKQQAGNLDDFLKLVGGGI